jgi:4-amino-4-deoxy-L-arabinose transferase-like glycosyltransferase
VLAHLSVELLGESPWTVRLPAALFGVAAIPALFRLGTAVTSGLEALLAAAILTVSYHAVWFSQNARGYSLLLFSVIVSTHLLLRWLAERRRSLAMWYALVTALGAYTHLTMVFVCVSQFVVCVFELVRRGRAGQRGDWMAAATPFAAAGLFTVLLYAPMLIEVHAFFTKEADFGAQVASPMWALLQAVQGLQVGFGALWGLAVGGVIFGAGVWSYHQQNPVALWLFLLPVPLTLGLGIAMGRPIFPRFVFFAVGFAILITVRGAAAVTEWMSKTTRIGDPRRMATAGALVLAAGAIAFSIRSLPYGYRFPKQDFASAVEFVERTRQPDDPVGVVAITTGLPIRDYLGKPWPQVDRQVDLQPLIDEGRDVWLVFTFPTYVAVGQPEVWAFLQRDCADVATFDGTVAGGAITVARCRPKGL